MAQVFNQDEQPYKNVTLKNLINLFAQISASNQGLKEHTFGDIWEIDLSETNYDESNENDVLRGMLQTIGDFISVLKNSQTLGIDTNTDYRMNENINCVPFTERFDNEVSGWVADISITVSFDASACVGDIN